MGWKEKACTLDGLKFCTSLMIFVAAVVIFIQMLIILTATESEGLCAIPDIKTYPEPYEVCERTSASTKSKRQDGDTFYDLSMKGVQFYEGLSVNFHASQLALDETSLLWQLTDVRSAQQGLQVTAGSWLQYADELAEVGRFEWIDYLIDTQLSLMGGLGLNGAGEDGAPSCASVLYDFAQRSPLLLDCTVKNGKGSDGDKYTIVDKNAFVFAALSGMIMLALPCSLLWIWRNNAQACMTKSEAGKTRDKQVMAQYLGRHNQAARYRAEQEAVPKLRPPDIDPYTGMRLDAVPIFNNHSDPYSLPVSTAPPLQEQPQLHSQELAHLLHPPFCPQEGQHVDPPPEYPDDYDVSPTVEKQQCSTT